MSEPDWAVWHQGYDTDPFLRRRLGIVQKHIAAALERHAASPLRVISMCAGEGRDLLGALETNRRRDLSGCLVEIDPGIADSARRRAADLGLQDISVVCGDAGDSAVYRPFAPADLVLECGVFGNISDDDMERTVRASSAFCAPGATLLWTRTRREPDMTLSLRCWLEESGFENIVYEPVPDSLGTVGVARFVGETQPLVDQRLFTFTRTDMDRPPLSPR